MFVISVSLNFFGRMGNFRADEISRGLTQARNDDDDDDLREGLANLTPRCMIHGMCDCDGARERWRLRPNRRADHGCKVSVNTCEFISFS